MIAKFKHGIYKYFDTHKNLFVTHYNGGGTTVDSGTIPLSTVHIANAMTKGHLKEEEFHEGEYNLVFVYNLTELGKIYTTLLKL